MPSLHIAIVDKNYEARIGSQCRSTFMLELEAVRAATEQASEEAGRNKDWELCLCITCDYICKSLCAQKATTSFF